MPKNSIQEKALTAVIMGATGDLSQKKLFPALFQLFTAGKLPEHFAIVAFSRRPWSHEDFRKFTLDSYKNLKHISKKNVKEYKIFLEKVFYHEGRFDDGQSFSSLMERLESRDIALGIVAEKFFYLAISPDSYTTVITKLGRAMKNHHRKMKPALLIEKPFGKSLKSAEALEKTVRHHFKGNEIFLVDHYLGKPALSRLASIHKDFPDVFDWQWPKLTTSITVNFFEKKDIEGRDEFYDATGAFLDVGQNHMLEILSSIMAILEKSSVPENIEKYREKAIKNLLIENKNISAFARGQYEGYRDEIGKSSQTETYFKVLLKSNDKNWIHVPIILEAGKALAESRVEVRIGIKDSDPIVIRIQPDPVIIFPIPGTKKARIIKVKEEFDAYAQIFFAAFNRDLSFFPSVSELYASWRLTDEIKTVLSKLSLGHYKKGSARA